MINNKMLKEVLDMRIALYERAKIYKTEAQWALDNARICIDSGDLDSAEVWHVVAHRYNCHLKDVNKELDVIIETLQKIIEKAGP